MVTKDDIRQIVTTIDSFLKINEDYGNKAISNTHRIVELETKTSGLDHRVARLESNPNKESINLQKWEQTAGGEIISYYQTTLS
ncbi:MAG: hypothetical protein LHV68_02835 [Elusimicrobia bacterium]|nr:hypothetical protein [Candidatus Liberimonas magnetica]